MVRLLRYSSTNGTGFGLVSADGDGVIDLGSRLEAVADLDDLLAAGRLGEAAAHAQDRPDHRLDAITCLPPLARPGKIFCIGVNYGGRAAEYADTTDAAYPSVFVRFPESLTGHRQPLIRPPESEQLDYEGEIVVVIGKPGRRIPRRQARTHIAALTIGNEGTVRDWVRHAKFNVTQGKNWNSSGAVGPWLVPIDEFGDLDDLTVTTTVNGEVRQHDTTTNMKYPIDYQIHYLSTFTTLQPGDLIFTGTPTGSGARQDPPRWLQPGDTVEVEVPGIGLLSNPVADEFPPEKAAAIVAPEPR